MTGYAIPPTSRLQKVWRNLGVSVGLYIDLYQ